jgi:general secretion pathway protein J
MRRRDSRRTRRGKYGEAGFTLVEVLVSLTLLALLSTMLLGGFQFGARSWERVTTVSEERDRVYATHSFLRQSLGTVALPSGLVRQAGATTLPVAGTDSVLGFVAPWRAGPVVSGLYLFRLWHDDGEGGQLMLSWRQVSGTETAGNNEGASGERVLLDGVAGMKLAYFGTLPEAPQGIWSDRWDTRSGRLLLLSLEIEFVDPRRTWPPLIIAPGM